MYSSHRSDSVTCLRLSSRWISAQSAQLGDDGPAWCRSGQTDFLQAPRRSSHRPTANSARQPQNAGPLRAPSRLPRQPGGQSHATVRHPRTSGVESRALGASSFSLPASIPPSAIEGRSLESASRGIRPRAASSRNGGRDHSGIADGFTPESAIWRWADATMSRFTLDEVRSDDVQHV